MFKRIKNCTVFYSVVQKKVLENEKIYRNPVADDVWAECCVCPAKAS